MRWLCSGRPVSAGPEGRSPQDQGGSGVGSRLLGLQLPLPQDNCGGPGVGHGMRQHVLPVQNIPLGTPGHKVPPPGITGVARNAGGAKNLLHKAIEWPHMRQWAFEALVLQSPWGVLLHSLPGCTKTTLARAAGGTASVAFLLLQP